MKRIDLGLLAGFLLILGLAACGDEAIEAADDPAPPPTESTGCPITIPDGGFTPPEPYAAEPVSAADGDVWYGSEGLWTVLPSVGDYGHRKSVWWSVDFPGGMKEERPEVTVTWTRLDDPNSAVITNQGRGTNAYTTEDGWFMIAGIDPMEAGCWQVDASYKGASLSYVYSRA